MGMLLTEFESKTAARLNRMRKYKGTVHLSDKVSCDGKTLEPSLFDDSPGDSIGHVFPYECPTKSDFHLWDQCVRSLVPWSLQLHEPLGEFIHEGHVRRRWFLSDDSSELYFVYDEECRERHSVFQLQQAAYSTRFGQRYKWQ